MQEILIIYRYICRLAKWKFATCTYLDVLWQDKKIQLHISELENVIIRYKYMHPHSWIFFLFQIKNILKGLISEKQADLMVPIIHMEIPQELYTVQNSAQQRLSKESMMLLLVIRNSYSFNLRRRRVFHKAACSSFFIFARINLLQFLDEWHL